MRKNRISPEFVRGLFTCLLISIFISNSQAQPGLLFNWAKSPQNTQPQGNTATALTMKADAAGNMYVGGLFMGTADFDPGPGVANFTSLNGGGDFSNNFFFAKYDAAGNYLFARTALSADPSEVYGMLVDGSGNIYITGNFNGTIDFNFDPAPGQEAILTAAGGREIFFAKYDPNGNYIFAKQIGGTAVDVAWTMTWDAAGDIIIIGGFGGTADFDPHPVNIATLTAGASINNYFAKYDQNGNYIFAKVLYSTVSNSNIRGVATDAANNIYLTGAMIGTVDYNPDAVAVANLSSISPGANDIFLAKYNSNGSYVFARNMGGGAGAPASGWGLMVDASGNPVIAGTYVGTVDLDPDPVIVNNVTSAGGSDIFISKYNSTGNFVFGKTMGGSSTDEARSITPGDNGSFYISGTFNTTIDLNPDPVGVANFTSMGSIDTYFAKYDVNGNFIYGRSIGGSSNDFNWAVTTGGTNQVYTCGNFLTTANFNIGGTAATLHTPGPGNVYFARYNTADGAYSYAAAIGGYPNVAFDEKATGITRDAADNVFVTGYFEDKIDLDTGPGDAVFTSAGGNDFFISKYTSAGAYVKAISIGNSSNQETSHVFTDATGNVYVTGTLFGTVDFDPGSPVVNLTSSGSSDIFIAKYNNNLDFIMAKKIGGTGADLVTGALLNANGIFITGYFSGTADFDPSTSTTVNLVSAGSTDIYFAKYDLDGNYLFAKRMGGTGGDEGRGISTGTSGNLFVTGLFTGTADLDPDPAVMHELTSNGGNDIFFGKYDVSGNYLFAKRIGSTSSEEVRGLGTDPSENLWITGYFSGTTDFNPDDAVLNELTAAAGNDMFIAKYDANGNYLLAKAISGSATEMPNDLDIDQAGNVYLTGYFAATTDFDPDPTGTAMLTPLGSSTNSFVAIYANNGNYILAQHFAGIGTYRAQALTLDHLGHAYLAGDFNHNIDLDPSSAATSITSWNGFSMFFGKYAVGLIIPLKLMNFTATLKTGMVQLDWTTASEQNTSHFDVQRSVNGYDFVDIARVTAAGNSSTQRNYYAIDQLDHQLATQPVIYYRLRMVDKDNGFTYAPIQRVRPTFFGPSVMLAGNPVTGNAVLIYENISADRMKLRITNTAGSQVLTQTIPVTNSKGQLSILTAGLAAGLYFIEVAMDDQIFVISMIKK